MARKALQANVVDSVLVSCRRRCCICFGLNRDSTEKAGQIAHLDRDNQNGALDNLAFLCLQHHDEYDRRPSQSKGLTIGEVKQFRAELRGTVKRVLEESVQFGAVALARSDPYAGHYVMEDSDITVAGELDLTSLPDTIEGGLRYFVSGFALFGGHRPQGPNMGELGFVAELKDGMLKHVWPFDFDRARESHTITITLTPDGLSLAETNHWGHYGINVSFAGEYKRAEKIDYSAWYWQNADARDLFGASEDPSE